MSSTWESHAQKLVNLVDANEPILAHLFLEKLMLLPVDVQDKIIDEISHLECCSSEQVAKIIGDYNMTDLR